MTIKPLHNWQLKLLSLLSAVVLWFFVVGIENTVYLFPESFAVKAHNLGKNVSLATALPEVKIYVNTGGKDIKATNKNDFEAFVDLSGLGAGSYELPVMASTQNAQVSVLKTDPEKVTVLLAPVGEKDVLITFSANGEPAPGYAVKEIKTEIGTAKITAAGNILEKIDSLTAEVVLSGSETADINQNITLAVPAELNMQEESVQIEPEHIKAAVVIIPAQSEKSVIINPVLTGEGDIEGIKKQIIVTPSAVKVKGEDPYLQTLTQVDTRPVRADSLLNRAAPLPVELDLPQGVELTELSQKVTVKLASDKF